MALRRGLLWLMLFALVAAQTLGLVHRVVHLSQFEGKAEVVSVHAQDEGHHSHAWTETLFGGHGGESECRLFDQLSHGGCLPSVAVVLLPVTAPLFFLQWFQGEALARWAALFDARGPPQLR
ncbi:hypothetical protein [Caenimonas soli]|jgi:hypothetical protein|uniref:hypothetical protein n=1 Tax=Caenimonas soli TaxID=2735555 RepID=UPI00155486C1|nr:hypothetical protein [Caenimonas soli]NPC57255.1 hypothetical protein [Caenimonas soli]